MVVFGLVESGVYLFEGIFIYDVEGYGVEVGRQVYLIFFVLEGVQRFLYSGCFIGEYIQYLFRLFVGFRLG